MKRLVLSIIALLAIVIAVRAYAQGQGPGISLSPGLVELSDGTARVGVSFGLAATEGGRAGPWSVLPLSLRYSSGSASASLSLSGLSFLLGSGIHLGRPVFVASPVVGDVVSAGGPVTVASRVEGDVWTLGADVSLKPGAEVTGSVVAIGGRISADPKARVDGGTHELAGLKIPFLGVLGTRFSVLALALGRETLLFLLEALLLFLLAFYLPRWLSGIGRSAKERWRAAILTLAVSLVVLPVLVALLVASLIGIFLLPFLALAVLALAGGGALGLCARFGAWMRREESPTPLHLFTSGLLGLFTIKAPGLVGLALGALRPVAAGRVGEVLRWASLAAGAILLAWGFGTALAHARSRSA